MTAGRRNIEGFSDLIGDIYQCSLTPALWDDTLTRFVSLFSPPDWDVAALMWEGMNTPSVRWVGKTGLVAHAIQGYEAVFAGINPWSSRSFSVPVGKVTDTDELLSRDEYLKSDLYQQFFKTWSMELAVFVIFDRVGHEQLALAMPGPDGRAIGGLKRGLRLIAPHVQRAMRISHRLAEAQLRAAGAEAALNLGHVAVLALRANLSVVSHNSRAEELIARGVFTMRDGRLGFSNSEAQRRLIQLSHAVTPESAAFRIEDDNGKAYSVLAITIRPQRAEALGGWIEGAHILVSISSPQSAPLLDVDRLSAWFDLTASEARLAAALTAGKSLQDFADERGVSVEAARYLLKGAFRKTGASSQAQLVAMIKDVPKS